MILAIDRLKIVFDNRLGNHENLGNPESGVHDIRRLNNLIATENCLHFRIVIINIFMQETRS